MTRTAQWHLDEAERDPDNKHPAFGWDEWGII